MDKKILHVIESLGIGGAETLLLNTINALGPEFTNVVVYLNEPAVLAPDFKNATLICLNHTGKKSLLKTILKIRRLIYDYKIELVHAHLLWPSIISRLACPSKVRLIYSVHSILSIDAFKPSPLSLFLEKITYEPRYEVIFVSEMVRKDYEAHVGLKGKSYVLYNFISDRFFKTLAPVKEYTAGPVKLLALGNLKEAKNYPYLIRAIKLLGSGNVTLDIYGEGHLRPQLQEMIDEASLKDVRLKGQATNIPEVLKNYDIFVLSSEHEGFGLAAIEAMACGLPCFLSDLPVLKEVTAGSAIFFDLKSEQDFVNKFLAVTAQPEQLRQLSQAGLERAKKFNRETYIRELVKIYNGIRKAG